MPGHDVVLSSGFLAFAQHAGFLQAVEEVSGVLRQPRSAAAVLWHTFRAIHHFPVYLTCPCAAST